MKNADEGFERPRAALIFRAVRDLACDNGGPQVSLGAIVGGLDSLMQESQHMPLIMLRADSVQQPLIIRIAEPAVSEVGRQFHVQILNLLPISLWPPFLFTRK
jgi:hypothetical protein